jgi:hypothetical protein
VNRTPFLVGIPVYKTGPATKQSPSTASDSSPECTCASRVRIVENKGEMQKKSTKPGKKRRKTLHRDMPKVRVKVEKKAFDEVLGRLIQSGPQSDKRLK